MEQSIVIEKTGPVTVVGINRPQARNSLDRATGDLLRDALYEFDNDDAAAVAVVHGHGGYFCAGADLKAMAAGEFKARGADEAEAVGPMRKLLTKPVIAAVAGPAVAGGLELAVWCDLRIAEESAYFGVYCRRWGVPMVDGGNVRLPRLIGASRAMDMILTGRAVSAREAYDMGLANRVVPDGESLTEAKKLAHELAAFPQTCLRADRMTAHRQWNYSVEDALRMEAMRGMEARAGRHGAQIKSADT